MREYAIKRVNMHNSLALFFIHVCVRMCREEVWKREWRQACSAHTLKHSLCACPRLAHPVLCIFEYTHAQLWHCRKSQWRECAQACACAHLCKYAHMRDLYFSSVCASALVTHRSGQCCFRYASMSHSPNSIVPP
mmetsp:Transcript_15498/g.39237  ORF Transcript_15498/g.39237 Transcript_15498/m.39237 type:complete len:135 (-) Transcript_15498:968-1372(-)